MLKVHMPFGKKRPLGSTITRFIILSIVAMTGLPALYADDVTHPATTVPEVALDPEEAHLGFYCALPVYLYEIHSASGIQFGYQLKKVHLRLDASIVCDPEVGDALGSVFANPSLGVFFSHDWQSKIRTYEGLVFGGEIGIHNSFSGHPFFINFLTGAEWFIFERKAFYLEIGFGVGINQEEGAYNGGTVIGGGIKTFF